MKWLLLAFIIFAQDNKADLKVNTALLFDDKDSCVSYVEKYKQSRNDLPPTA